MRVIYTLQKQQHLSPRRHTPLGSHRPPATHFRVPLRTPHLPIRDAHASHSACMLSCIALCTAAVFFSPQPSTMAQSMQRGCQKRDCFRDRKPRKRCLSDPSVADPPLTDGRYLWRRRPNFPLSICCCLVVCSRRLRIVCALSVLSVLSVREDACRRRNVLLHAGGRRGTGAPLIAGATYSLTSSQSHDLH